MIDMDKLVEAINEDRNAAIRVTTNAGKIYDLPPGTHAYYDQFTMYVAWPPEDPEHPFRVSKSIWLATMNIASVEKAKPETV